jgi:hypothetical protein
MMRPRWHESSAPRVIIKSCGRLGIKIVTLGGDFAERREAALASNLF